MGPFEAVGPVGESDPFPELHAALETSVAANTTVRIRPVFQFTDICAFCRSPSTRRPAIGLARRLAQGLRLCKNCAPTLLHTDYTDKADDKSREALDTLLPSVDAE